MKSTIEEIETLWSVTEKIVNNVEAREYLAAKLGVGVETKEYWNGGSLSPERLQVEGDRIMEQYKIDMSAIETRQYAGVIADVLFMERKHKWRVGLYALCRNKGWSGDDVLKMERERMSENLHIHIPQHKMISRE